MAWGSGPGRPGSRRCSGPWRLGAVQLVLQREGGFDPHRQLDVLSRHGATNVFTTPTAMRSMMGIDDAGTPLPAAVPHRLQRGRAAQPGGDPLVPRAVRRHGARLLRPDRVLSAGRQLPVPGGARGLDGQADAGLGRADPRRGRAAGARPASAARSACARAPTRTTRSATGATRRRARRRSAASGSTPRTPRATDEDGYVWYEGRADDVIIAAGYRIGPFEVESACLEHPAVAEAAAVASPDERRGNVVKAFIVCAAGAEPSDELADEIKAFVRGRLGAHAYPRRIEFVDGLPKTLTGKIRRIELRQRGAGRLSAARAVPFWRRGSERHRAPPATGAAPADDRPAGRVRRARAARRAAVAADGRGALLGPRVALGAGRGRRRLRACCRPTACGACAGRRGSRSSPLSLLAAYASSGLPLVLLKPRRIDELGAGCPRAPRRSRACGCPTPGRTRGRATRCSCSARCCASAPPCWPSGRARAAATAARRRAATRSSRSACC